MMKAPIAINNKKYRTPKTMASIITRFTHFQRFIMKDRV